MADEQNALVGSNADESAGSNIGILALLMGVREGGRTKWSR